MQISILGAGTWGTALASVLINNNHSVRIWHRKPEFVEQLAKNQIHPNLPNFELDSRIKYTSNLHDLENYDALLIAVPSQVVREVLYDFTILNKHKPVICASKGIENSSNLLMNEVISEVLSMDMNKIVALSGPSHAEEVIAEKVTTVVTACKNIETARLVRDMFANDYFRVYSSDDIIGVEIGGAIKNVIAIASGICKGLQLGDNTQAALITRGLEEIKRLGVAMGGNKNTFSGLSGLGDLIVTSFSEFSRNCYVGKCLGKGMKLNKILSSMDMVAEGVSTTKSVNALKEKYNIEMPISSEIFNVIFNNKPPKDAIRDLMNRNLVDEHC